MLVVSVKEGKSWRKLFKQKLSSKKSSHENIIDLYFDGSDVVVEKIKEGLGRFKKGIKIKMELVEKAKSSKKKSLEKKGRKKKSSKQKSSSKRSAVSKQESKDGSKKVSSFKRSTKSKTKKRVHKLKKNTPTNKAKSSVKTSKPASRTTKPKPKSTVKHVSKVGPKPKSKTTTVAKRKTSVKRGRKPATKSRRGDDLKRIIGIGPKMERILHSNGVKTFAALSAVGVRKLQGIIDGAGGYYRSYRAGMWKSEAALAKDGKFNRMKSGRR